jgi:polysaccharide pyruvyl transferase WcaK-like protein
MRNKFLVVNAWGNNRGDEALIDSFLSLINEIAPASEIDITPIALEYREPHTNFGQNVRWLKNRIGSFYLSPLAFRLYNMVPSNILNDDKKGWYLTRIFQEFAHFHFPHLRWLRKYDMIFFCPQGQVISSVHRLRFPGIYPLMAADHLGIPFAIVGVSVGPFEDSGDAFSKSVERVLSNAKQILVREKFSEEHLKNCFPGLGNISRSVDIVFSKFRKQRSFPPEKSEMYSEFLSRLPDDVIGINVSLSPASERGEKLDINAYRNKMVSFFDKIIDYTGRDLVAFRHIDRDGPFLLDVISAMKNSRNVHLLPFDLGYKYHVDMISRLDFMVSTRYHPSIFAIVGGTPFMAIMQHFKVQGMLAEIGLENNACWQDEDADAYFRLFQQCYENRQKLKENVEKSCEVALAKSDVYRAVMSRLLADDRRG